MHSCIDGQNKASRIRDGYFRVKKSMRKEPSLICRLANDHLHFICAILGSSKQRRANVMIGAIMGDMIGAPYEFSRRCKKRLPKDMLGVLERFDNFRSRKTT